MKNKIKLSPNVFRRAARVMEKGTCFYSCHAICHARSKEERDVKNDPYILFLVKWFKPEKRIRMERAHGWWGKAWNNPKAQNARIVALCLCADILESEQEQDDG